MNCEAARAAMDAQFAGEEPARVDAALEAHLASCPSCRERYERLARVDVALSAGGLAEPRLEQLEARLFARLGAEPAAPVAPPSRGRWRGWVVALSAAAAALVLVVPLWRLAQPDPFTPRGSAAESWGVRAFCVGPEAKVTAEAVGGGTLPCGPGASVQFTYTAPKATTLELTLESGARLFPDDGASGALPPGVDAPLPRSTPVGDWLSGPQVVSARFTDADGAVVATSRLTLTPPAPR